MINDDVSGHFDEPDIDLEQSLRPKDFVGFSGQDKVVERLLLMIEAAKHREDVLEHILLCGPPGLGKTTLATIIAQTVGANLHTVSGPQIDKAADLAGVLTNLTKGDILFIDEIHRLHPAIEEYLYPAMEDYKLDIMIDSGPSARSVELKLPKFTLLGATTRSGSLTAPLRSRFGLLNRMDYYNIESLSQILLRSSTLLGVELLPEGAKEIALRSRGTPRIANNLLRWVRDYTQVRAAGIIDQPVAIAALQMIDIDEDGLDEMDKQILEALIHKFNGSPVGLNTLAMALGEESSTIEEVNEPFLMMKGFIKRTPRGRVAMPAAYEKFGLQIPSGLRQEQPELFQ